MYCINYKRFNVDNGYSVDSIISSLALTNYTNEGLCDLENSGKYFSVKYYKVLPSAELLFDNKTNKILAENRQKVLTSNLIFNKSKKFGSISGNPTSCKFFEDFLISNSPIQLVSKVFTFEKIVSQFRNFDYLISKISYSTVNFLNTEIPSITLEFNSNQDVFNIIKKFNSPPYEVNIKVHFEEGDGLVKINLRSGSLNLSTNNLKTVSLELLKEKLHNLLEEDSEDV